ncbi:MAG: DUF2855 family protein [Ilumatobacteraceae bacterium]
MDFEVRRDDLRSHRTIDVAAPEPAEGQVLLHIDHAALTSNNITYGAFGDMMGYWNFFPGADEGWGRVPVWGFADVVTSRVDGIADGDRFYGYLPMSTHLVVEPTRVTPHGFSDGVAHRAPMSPVYNQYAKVTDRTSDHDEHLRAVLRPLFTTSFLIDDWLTEQQSFGATSVVIASASSKTALALAALLHDHGTVSVVGLTSERNAEFVRGVGYYDSVVTYDAIGTIDASVPTAFVDMGGDAEVVAGVHRHLGGSLVHSCQVGATHWEQVGRVADLPGPAPTMFFAPDQVRKRTAEWGSSGFDERVDSSWQRFIISADGWLEIVVQRGPDAVAQAFADVRDGLVPANQAYVISLDA